MHPQTNDGQLHPTEKLAELLDIFPIEYVDYVFGYGSGVFSQQTHNSHNEVEEEKDSPLIDLIIAVNDTKAFHKASIEKNPTHYWLPLGVQEGYSSDWVTWWQEAPIDTSWLRNPKVYFNVTPKIKYGVVHADDLVEDLSTWKYLYLAGRLQKPTATIYSRPNLGDLVQEAQTSENLPAALTTSLSLLSEGDSNQSASTVELFTKIASLSYIGDPRVAAGAEDPLKLEKLVRADGQLDRWHRLYKDSLDSLEARGILTHSTKRVEWDASAVYPPHDIQYLPARVGAAARCQSLKGLVSAGPHQAWKYALRKFSKGLLRRR